MGDRGEDDDLGLADELQPFEGIEPVEARHFDIEQNDRRFQGFLLLECDLAILGLADDFEIRVYGENLPDDVPHETGIIDD